MSKWEPTLNRLCYVAVHDAMIILMALQLSILHHNLVQQGRVKVCHYDNHCTLVVTFSQENPSAFVVVVAQVRLSGQCMDVVQTSLYWQRKPEKPVGQLQEKDPFLFAQVPPWRQGAEREIKRGHGSLQ